MVLSSHDNTLIDCNHQLTKLTLCITHHFYHATHASAVLAVVILYVRPSVCHMHALWQNQTMHSG